MKHSASIVLVSLLMFAPLAAATEFHVAIGGDDGNDGSSAKPFRTISAAAQAAQPGDVVTVHAGVYREHVSPPRGGESDAKRIVYQAAEGEKVAIKGSEAVTGWRKVKNDTWRAVVPNSLFGTLNPYNDPIQGDWFNPKGRVHHTGAVYLDGEWLIEAAKLDEVLAPADERPAWLEQAGTEYLLNVAWFRPDVGARDQGRVDASHSAAKNGTQNAPCSEGGECVGFIEHGHWVKYEGVDFGGGASALDIRAASASNGGVIEIRADAPDGELLGTCAVPNTGGWQDWRTFKPAIKPQQGVKTLCLVFRSGKSQYIPDSAALWFAQAGDTDTTIWAQFKGIDPNQHLVEINVRRTVFYPDKTGVNYITVRGFTLSQAAAQWAPPTAEQTAIIGTNWSKGWVIENNTISHSVCCGIALGKHGDEFDNTSADTAEGYVKTIERATARGWSKENIGSHLVRNNTISHCEQTGIVGSMGAVFSTITGNTIHDIHVRRLFTGAEMAGIKLHGAIDVEISGNHIYRTCLGTWLDWMAQGAHVTGNLYHDNLSQDLFVEVDHGPFVVDNNIFLSPGMLLSVSQGGAYVHNLICGGINSIKYDARLTPFHKPHSTEVAGMHDNPRGDDRYFNNVFVGPGDLRCYDKTKMPVLMGGNVFVNGAKPAKCETDALVMRDVDPAVRLVEKPGGLYLELNFDKAWSAERGRKLITTEILGKAAIPDAAFEQRDGEPLRINTDFFHKERSENNPTPGPFENPGTGPLSLKVR